MDRLLVRRKASTGYFHGLILQATSMNESQLICDSACLKIE